MTNLPQNSSSIGAFHLLPPQHYEFEELCALSLAGELSAEEQERLDAHLEGCEACRAVWDEYHNDAARVLAQIAAMTHPLDVGDEEGANFDLEAGKRRLLADVDQIDRERAVPKKPASHHKLIITLLVLTASLALCGAALVLEDHLQRRSESHPTPPVPSPAAPTPAPVQLAAVSLSPPSKAPDEEVARLRSELRQSASNEVDLRRQLNELTSKLQDAEQGKSEREEQNAQLLKQIETRQAEIEALHQSAQTAATTQSQVDRTKQELEALQRTVAEKDHVIASDAELLSHDRDIRDLIGARNLLIAEIYDVGQNGQRNLPFGRVFYTRDKSLVFYGYDLDKQPGLAKAVAFQAWGKSSNGRDVNLGLFYKDDSSKRWVVKFNDASTLARLKSVFVTVEPVGGSEKPTGKPLLAESLRIDPNHP